MHTPSEASVRCRSTPEGVDGSGRRRGVELLAGGGVAVPRLQIGHLPRGDVVVVRVVVEDDRERRHVVAVLERLEDHLVGAGVNLHARDALAEHGARVPARGLGVRHLDVQLPGDALHEHVELGVDPVHRVVGAVELLAQLAELLVGGGESGGGLAVEETHFGQSFP